MPMKLKICIFSSHFTIVILFLAICIIKGIINTVRCEYNPSSIPVHDSEVVFS
ncbi:unnamed protein product [Brugia timori]|uniref:Col_cuticle_N domain-containing protein n=1 Tax=Brugia timori TaxID=42155 RepID=A0A0R3QEE2_9BILA|nr:unnamed protein product [Brugia timori]